MLQWPQIFDYESKASIGVLRKPKTTAPAHMGHHRMQKTGFGGIWGPPTPREHRPTPKRRAQGPPGAEPCRGDPKGPAWPPGATGGEPRGRSWCTAPWWVSVHGCARAHVRRASPQCKVSGFVPGASRSFGASIGPLGTERVDLRRRWPKTFLLCPRSEDFFKNGTV